MIGGAGEILQKKQKCDNNKEASGQGKAGSQVKKWVCPQQGGHTRFAYDNVVTSMSYLMTIFWVLAP